MPHIMLPENKRVIFESLLEQNLQTKNYRVIKKFTEGNSGAQMYLVQVGETKYVLRILEKKTSSLISEYAATRIASILDIGPELVFADIETGVFLLEYIEQSKQRTFDQPETTAKQISRYLKKLTQLRISSKNDKFLKHTEELQSWPLEKVPKHLRRLLESCLKGVREAYPYYENLDPILSHNDLHFDNVLLSEEKAYIIDWEDYAISNIYDEMASVIYRVLMDESLSDKVMEHYFGRAPTELEKSRLYIASMIALYNRGIEELARLSEEKRVEISEETLKNLPGMTTYAKQLLRSNAPVTEEKRLRYAWSILKTLSELEQSDGFKEALRILKQDEKRDKRDFKALLRGLEKRL